MIYDFSLVMPDLLIYILTRSLMRGYVSDKKLKEIYKGKKFRVVHCKGATKSFNDALLKVDARKRKTFEYRVILQILRLANGERMSKESFPQEGDLPKRKGQSQTKKFNALKRIPVRGYCWHSDKYRATYFVSHYVYKNYDKLKVKDTTIVGNNWERIEVNDDDC